ncbi:MAG: flagellar motor switch protein FliN [Thiomonas sp.]|nr:flagellar motor switch protein FliN [Thiomonas sp.]
MAENPTTDTTAADDLADWGEAMAEQGVTPEAPAATAAAQPKVQPAPFAELRAEQGSTAANNQLDLVMDIPVTLSVELGRTKIQIRELLQLAQGSVVDLDRLAGEPMDVLVNGFLIARGEVVLVNDKFGIRLTDIVSPTERARRLA